jgi:hypothetical protein
VTEKRESPRQPPHPSDERLVALHGGSEAGSVPGVDPIVDALLAPATSEELRDEGHYLDMFDLAGPQPGQQAPWRVPRAPKSLRTIRIGGRVAALLAAGLVAGVGVAAAYTGTLPRGLESMAHRNTGTQTPATRESSSSAPAASRTAPATTNSTDPRSATTTPTTPGATPSGVPTVAGIDGARGRCTAWSHGGLAPTSAAYRQLVADANGAEHISTYCASVAKKPAKPTKTRKADPKKHPKERAGHAPKSRSHGTARSAPPGHLKKAAV